MFTIEDIREARDLTNYWRGYAFRHHAPRDVYMEYVDGMWALCHLVLAWR